MATKFTDNTVYSIVGAPPTASPRQLADTMANGWTEILQQRGANQVEIDQYFMQIPRSEAKAMGPRELDARIETTEVAAALRRCHRGKAQGPDGLPNDWYRDNMDRLAPIIAALFSRWLRTGVVPASQPISSA